MADEDVKRQGVRDTCRISERANRHMRRLGTNSQILCLRLSAEIVFNQSTTSCLPANDQIRADRAFSRLILLVPESPPRTLIRICLDEETHSSAFEPSPKALYVTAARRSTIMCRRLFTQPSMLHATKARCMKALADAASPSAPQAIPTFASVWQLSR